MSNDNANAIPRWVGRLLAQCSKRPRRVIVLGVVTALALAAFAPWVRVDTDPENMLREDEPVRVRHRELKRVFAQHDLVVVGVVNTTSAQGILDPSSLTKLTKLTRYAEALADDGQDSIIAHDILSLATVDDITPLGENRVRFDWLMREPPSSEAEAQSIGHRAMRNPFLVGTVISADRQAAAVYIPIASKDKSYGIARTLDEYARKLGGPERYYIAGLPVAEDTFGVEMFIQMAISAPAAMALVFIMMLVFFRRLKVVAAPMVVAMLSVLITMGALIATGNSLHIMSSMIPIFIMPIAVLDSIHIVSELYDRYDSKLDREVVLRDVIGDLYRPMLFTSLTSAAGFASLALTPIPPVQVFGIFVAIGIMVAWFLTITIIPAWFILLSDETLSKFGGDSGKRPTVLPKALARIGRFSERRWPHLLALSGVLVGVAVFGVSRIEINDNPVKWFAKDHELRRANDIMNHHFGGTYMAYLAIESRGVPTFAERLDAVVAATPDEKLRSRLVAEVAKIPTSQASKTTVSRLEAFIDAQEDAASGPEADAWGDLGARVADLGEAPRAFTSPALLRYMRDYQRAAESAGLVGKATSIADIAEVVYRELRGGVEELEVPPTDGGVAQALLAFESSHRPHLLRHFVTADFSKACIWLQLRRGDNKDMEALHTFTAAYLRKHPPPQDIDMTWFGLTHLNSVWQDKMVGGMTRAIIGSSLVIFLLMSILLGSAAWGLVSLVPFAVSIVVIYGGIGLAGKAYDMPVAVLSCLTLGLAVDFAIHFTVRAQALHRTEGTWSLARAAVFGAPARAISRNALVVAIGFTPLLLAPLTPYKTVGLLLASILLLSALASLFLLPALLTPLASVLFRERIRFSTGSIAVSVAAVGALSALVAPELLGLSPWLSAAIACLVALAAVALLRWHHTKRS